MVDLSNNIVLPFTLSNADVKGRVVKLNDALDIILHQHQYPEAVTKIIAELLMIASLLGSQFKDDALLSLQLQIKDTKEYIIVDFESPGNIRGYAQCRDASYQELLSDSILIVTVDRKDNQRYQGMVDVSGLSISEAIELYFKQSEQIPTSIKLYLGKVTIPNQQESWCGAGMMLQRLPSDNDDHWHEALLYFSTLRIDEILEPNRSLEKLLYAMYNELSVKIYEPIAIQHQCRCSRGRVLQVLKSLGKEEVEAMMIDDKISVECQFCNDTKYFTYEDISGF